MTAQKHIVALGESEVRQLTTMIRKGVSNARVITRARVLLMANELNGTGKKDTEIAEALSLGRATVERIRRRYAQGGINRALYDAPRPGKKRKVTGRDETQIVSIACTDPPDGYDHWTMDLFTEHVVKELKKTVSRSTVYRVLIRHDTKPWREKNLVYPDTGRGIYQEDDGRLSSVRTTV